MPTEANERFLRKPEVLRISGLSKSTIYSLIECGQFPRPVKIGPNVSAWVQSEISSWVKSRISARDKRHAA